MSVVRNALVVVSLAVATVVGAGAGAGAGTRAVIAPEADVAHHGHVSLWGGRLGVWLVSENHGPSSISQATVRLEFSEPPAASQELPPGCLRAGDRVLLCATGALKADGARQETALDLQVTGSPNEVTVKVGTLWNGGATDRNPQNNEHRVLVPATGDPYVF